MRAIDADSIIKLVTDSTILGDGFKYVFVALVNGEPTIQPEQKKGKWNFIGDNMFECSMCGASYTTQQLNFLRNYETDPYLPWFCPHCGSDMRGEEDV